MWDFTDGALLPDGELAFTAVDEQAGVGLFRTDGDEASLIRSLDSPYPGGFTRSGDWVSPTASRAPKWPWLS